MEYYDDLTEKEERSFKYKKESEAPTCNRCGYFMVATKKPSGVKWHCGNIDCFHSFVEPYDD